MIDKTEILKHAFNQLAPFSDEEWETMKTYIIERSFKKGESLCKIGQTEQYLSMIYEGVCRGYYSKNGEEISVAFMFPEDYVSAYYSFLTQRPSLMGIQALSPVTVVSISKNDLERLYKQFKNAEKIGRLNAERIYRRKEEREIALLTMSATERYMDLQNRYPQFLRKIPLKYIASFLGIQPESLSRIRKQLAKK